MFSFFVCVKPTVSFKVIYIYNPTRWYDHSKFKGCLVFVFLFVARNCRSPFHRSESKNNLSKRNAGHQGYDGAKTTSGAPFSQHQRCLIQNPCPKDQTLPLCPQNYCDSYLYMDYFEGNNMYIKLIILLSNCPNQ